MPHVGVRFHTPGTRCRTIPRTAIAPADRHLDGPAGLERAVHVDAIRDGGLLRAPGATGAADEGSEALRAPDADASTRDMFHHDSGSAPTVGIPFDHGPCLQHDVFALELAPSVFQCHRDGPPQR